jgi:cytochrome c peroxidase
MQYRDLLVAFDRVVRPIRGPEKSASWRRCLRLALICLALLPVTIGAPAQPPVARLQAETPTQGQEPITPVPQPPPADPLKVALGERLFADRRLSHDGTRSCLSCHDVHADGAGDGLPRVVDMGSNLPLNTLTVFNAALSFRLNWEGNVRTLEGQARASVENSANMRSSIGEVLGKLLADPNMVSQFDKAYGRQPDEASLLDAIATYERSLLTPGSRFDQWLGGDTAALTPEEQNGYKLFKSLGCISCHQGVNVGGNLFQRHGIFHPLGASKPEILRVPSLRNVATTAPYFHDGSASTLGEAVRRMAAAQLDQDLSDQQIQTIASFLQTLTGKYRGVPVAAKQP